MIDFQRIQHKLSSIYSLNISFSRRFPYIDGPSFSPYKPLQNVDVSKVSNMQFFFRNCTHILTRTQGKKFEDMFLVKIASNLKSERLIVKNYIKIKAHLVRHLLRSCLLSFKSVVGKHCL